MKFSIFNFQFSIIVVIGLVLPFLIFAGGSGSNIDTNDANEHWSWNDIIGWIDWHDTHHNIIVNGNELTGYADSSAGKIILNCAVTPDGDICGNYTQPFKVNNDGAGGLSGWAWNDTIGWISFCGNSSENSSWNSSLGKWVCPNSTTYQVKIRNGYFENWAWNDIVGWVGFKCEDDPNVNQSDCDSGRIFEDWRIQTAAGSSAQAADFTSSIFDSGSDNNIFNTIMWQGALNGGRVEFRAAGSNTSGGPWSYGSWFGASFGVPSPLNLNNRYLRYQVRLTTDLSQTNRPRIDDIIINYSP
mgnify:CR=1 FL=1